MPKGIKDKVPSTEREFKNLKYIKSGGNYSPANPWRIAAADDATHATYAASRQSSKACRRFYDISDEYKMLN